MSTAKKQPQVDEVALSIYPTSTTASASPPKAEPTTMEPFKPTYRFWLVFLAFAVLTLMVAIDSTSLSVALPIIAQKLHGTAIEAFWAGTSFLLASTVFQPSFASFSHIFGRRPMLYAAMTFFLLGTLVCATAGNFTFLLVGRSIQGIGSGGIVSLTDIVITDLVPLRLRGNYVGIISSQWAIGSVMGPVIGGAFAQTWRWIFYINLPFIILGWIMVFLFLKLNILHAALASKLRRIDFVGTLLFVGGTTSFLLGLSWGGVLHPWASVQTLVPILIGVASMILFVLYEAKLAKEPLIPPSLFNNTTANIAYLIDAWHGCILWCLLYYLPLYFEAVQGYRPIIAGVALFPETFTVAPLAIVTGCLVTKTGKYRCAILSGFGLTTFGVFLNLHLDIDTSVPAWIFLTTVSGIGLGMLFGSMEFAVQAASSDKDQAYAVATFSFFRTFGQAIGVAVGGVVFQNQMIKNLRGSKYFATQSRELARDAAALVQLIKETADPDQKLELRLAYMRSLRTIFIVLGAISFASFLLAFFIKDYDMDRALTGNQGFKEKLDTGDEEETLVIVDQMKLEYTRAQGCASPPTHLGFFTPTICLSEPIDIDIVLEDDDLDLLGLEAQVRLTGTIQLNRYETLVRHGTVELKAVPVRTEQILDISTSAVLNARRTPTSIDLASLGVDVAQLPSSLDVMGHSSRDDKNQELVQLLSTEPPMLKMSVRYTLSVSSSNPQHHPERRESRRDLRVLGTSLTERESRLETTMLWPKAGYSATAPLNTHTEGLQFLKWPRTRHSRTPSTKKSLKIDILSYEPIIVRQQSESATMSLVLGLKYSNTSLNQEREETPPYPVVLSASWTLQSTTEMTGNSAVAVHHPQEPSSIQLTDLRVLHGKKQKLTNSTSPSNSNWQREDEKSESSSGSSSSSSSSRYCHYWTDKQQHELHIAATSTGLPRRFLTPTMFTDKLQHTYNLKLKVAAQLQLPKRSGSSGSGILGHMKTTTMKKKHCFEFDLPVTVVYEARTPGETPGYGSEMSPPGYEA